MGAAAAAAAIRRAEKRVLDRLRDAGATSPETARELPELRFIESRRLQHLKDAGAIGETSPGHYWVNEPVYAQLRTERRHVAWIALAVVIVILLWSLWRTMHH